ncbi:hypothetical protein, partial [Escherichia coli]|uniref:hypothetical protein n=1 Tax=Escherichia coli TaxID=562 RepID=UPI001A7EFBE6
TNIVEGNKYEFMSLRGGGGDKKIKGSSCDPFFLRVICCLQTKKPPLPTVVCLPESRATNSFFRR